MFLFIIIILVGIANFFYLLPPVINWDEGTHALWGFKEWLVLRSGDWHLFWQLSRAQFSYPPLGSWLIALTNLPTEFSLNLARFSSTIGFIVGGVLLLLIARVLPATSLVEDLLRRQSPSTSLGPTPRKLTNFSVCHPRLYYLLNTKYFSILLYLTSPAILFYSVTVFKESWGMALTLLVIYLYFLASEKKKIIYYLLTGLALTLLFFEKYNYAVLLGLVLGLEGVVELSLLCSGALKKTRPSPRYFLIKVGSYLWRQLALFLPITVFASWWILTPDNKLPQFLDIMRSDWNPVTVGAGNSWQYLTFFVQSIRVSYIFSDVIFLFTVFCYLLSIKDLWQKKIRVLWLFFTINFVLGTMHSINLQDRYILTSVPALFLLVGYELSQLAGPVSRLVGRRFSAVSKDNSSKTYQLRRLPPASIFLILVVALVLMDVKNFPQLLKSNATHMLLSPMYNETDYHDTLFDFNKSEWPQNSKQLTVNRKQETTEGVIDYILDNVDINKPINYLGWTAEISPDWIELRRQMALRKNQGNKGNKGSYLVTIEVKPTSRLYTYDYRRANLWQLANIAEFSKNNKDKLIKQKDFKQLGVTVKIYHAYELNS